MNVRIADNGGKTADRYTVLIGRDYYYMSDDANMPNGVCMYGGYTDGAWGRPGEKIISIEDAPTGVKKQIEYLKNQFELYPTR